MRRVAMAALAVMVLGVAGTAEARERVETYHYGYSYGYEAAPRRTVRVRRARGNRQGFFARLMELERRKNAWLAERFGLR